MSGRARLRRHQRCKRGKFRSFPCLGGRRGGRARLRRSATVSRPGAGGSCGGRSGGCNRLAPPEAGDWWPCAGRGRGSPTGGRRRPDRHGRAKGARWRGWGTPVLPSPPGRLTARLGASWCRLVAQAPVLISGLEREPGGLVEPVDLPVLLSDLLDVREASRQGTRRTWCGSWRRRRGLLLDLDDETALQGFCARHIVHENPHGEPVTQVARSGRRKAQERLPQGELPLSAMAFIPREARARIVVRTPGPCLPSASPL